MLGQKLKVVSEKINEFWPSLLSPFRNAFFPLFIFVFFLKLTALPWASHPFDFWSFTYVLQRPIFLEWNLFEGWNKGVILLSFWTPLYSFYSLVLSIFGGVKDVDNIMLLHFLLKLPFLFLDVLCAILLSRLVRTLTDSKVLARRTFWLWYLNPLPFLVYGVHGHYELLTAFSIVLLLYGAVLKKPLFSVIGFIIGIQVKYFLIILLPFYLLAECNSLFTKESLVRSLKTVSLTALGLVLSFYPYLVSPDLRQQLSASVIKLSKVNTPSSIDVAIVKAPATNIFSGVFFLLNDRVLTSLDGAFGWIKLGYGLSFLGLLALFLYRLYRIYFKRNEYSLSEFIADTALALVIFVVPLSNFQAHYFVWFVPAIVCLLSVRPTVNLSNAFAIFVGASAIYYLRGENGTAVFFADLLRNFNVTAFSSKYYQSVYTEGALVILSLISIGATLMMRTRIVASSKRYLQGIHFIYSVIWLLIVAVFIQFGISVVHTDSLPNRLVVDRARSITKGMVHATHEPIEVSSDRITFNQQSRSRSLVLQKFIKNDSYNNANYQAYIADDALMYPSNVTSFENSALYLNGCKIQSEVESITLSSNGKTVNAKRVENNCLKEVNVLTGPGVGDLRRPVLYLRIVPLLFSLSNKYIFYAAVGGVLTSFLILYPILKVKSEEGSFKV